MEIGMTQITRSEPEVVVEHPPVFEDPNWGSLQWEQLERKEQWIDRIVDDQVIIARLLVQLTIHLESSMWILGVT